MPKPVLVSKNRALVDLRFCDVLRSEFRSLFRSENGFRSVLCSGLVGLDKRKDMFLIIRVVIPCLVLVLLLVVLLFTLLFILLAEVVLVRFRSLREELLCIELILS